MLCKDTYYTIINIAIQYNKILTFLTLSEVHGRKIDLICTLRSIVDTF